NADTQNIRIANADGQVKNKQRFILFSARFALLWLSPKIGGTLTASIMGGARQNKTSFTLLSLAP
ncbi:MAG: hypothetical protein IJC08_05715, partial [Bacteroidaceae bacterium]|nr:hypothetical protein [Bacteroidaceae bacterium]